MRSVLANDHRRRRLRLIKEVGKRLAKSVRSVLPALSVPADTKETRQKLVALRAKLFKECQGNSSTILRIERIGKSPINVKMNRPFFLIGRDSSCDLRLDDEAVMPRHCYLQWIDGHLFCTDVAHRTNFFPNRFEQTNGSWIAHQPISIGPYQLSLVDDSNSNIPDFSPLDRSAALAAELPHLGLQFDGIEQSENVWPINRMLTMIGRGPQCKLRLNHKSIAYVHACLLRTQHGCWFIDLAKDGTTGVNDQAIRFAPVDVEDVLRLGSFSINVITTDFMPVVPSESEEDSNMTGIRKPLPPIRFERQPIDQPQNSVGQTSGTESPPAEEIKPPAVRIRASASPLEIVTPPLLAAPSTSDIHPSGSEIAVASPATALVGFDLQSPLKAVAIRIQPGAVTFPKVSEWNLQPSVGDHSPLIRPEPLSNLKAPDSVPKSKQQLNSQPSTVPVSIAQTPPPSVSNEALAEFIAQQISQLAALKTRLTNLKHIYDDAAGKMISKRTKETLEKPVTETMKTYEEMEELLTTFLRSHDRLVE